MSKEGVIYSSGVKPRTEAILRAFAAKNDLTLSQLMDILAHVVAGYGTMKMFDGKVREFDPQFERFDSIVRDWVEKNTPESYRRIPFLQRMFGTLYKPLTRQDLEKIDVTLAQEEEEARKEAPDVNPEDME